MNANDIFFDSTGTLRSGWRVVVFILAFLFAAAITSTAAFVGLSILSPLLPSNASSAGFIASGFATLIPALLVGWLCGKYFDRVPFRALGAWFTERWFTHLLGGMAFGAISLLLAVAIAMIAGGLRFDVNQVPTDMITRSLVASLAVFAVGAAWEEAVFRGYLLQTLSRSGLAWLGIALTSVFFGAIHIMNPNATIISIVDTVLAGVWFGVAYLKTRDLWFVWGMHLVWNWMLGSVFGIEVSGITDLVTAPLLREIDTGPVWLTGGSYGIEGGIASTIALILSTVVIYFLPLKPDEEMKAMTDPSIKGAGVF